MDPIKVTLLDGTVKSFQSATPVVAVYDQFWMQVNDQAGNQVGAVPREQVKFVSTSIDQGQ